MLLCFMLDPTRLITGEHSKVFAKGAMVTSLIEVNTSWYRWVDHPLLSQVGAVVTGNCIQVVLGTSQVLKFYWKLSTTWYNHNWYQVAGTTKYTISWLPPKNEGYPTITSHPTSQPTVTMIAIGTFPGESYPPHRNPAEEMAEGDLVTGHWVGGSPGVHSELLCKSKVKANTIRVDAEYSPHLIFRSFTYGWSNLTFYLLQDHYTNICFFSNETALDLTRARHVPCYFQCLSSRSSHDSAQKKVRSVAGHWSPVMSTRLRLVTNVHSTTLVDTLSCTYGVGC